MTSKIAIPTRQFKTHELRIPPQNIETEKALLGSLMLRPDGMYDVADIVSRETFYVDKHRMLFDAMLELHTRHEPIDLLSVSTRLKERGKFDAIGGGSYLAELVDTVPSSTNAKHYAEIIQRKYILRALIDAAAHISELGYNEVEQIENVLDEAEKKIYSVTNSSVSKKFIGLKDTLEEAWERLDKMHKTGGELRGVPSGFAELDTLLSGFQKSDLIILAARPSMGKTTLALDIARQAAIHHNIPVGIFSLEMNTQQLVDKMLSAEARVNAWKLRTGKLSLDEDFDKLRNSLDRLSKAPIFIDDQSGNTIMKMRSAARKLKSEHGLGLIIVDYLQLMNTARHYDSMVNQVTEISHSLKGLAKDLDVPVIALSQLSRALESRGGKPKLSDLRDSGSIEQDADVVMFIHREDKMDKNAEKTNVAEIIVEKHRNGPVGAIKLYFDEEKSTFMSIDKHHEYNGVTRHAGGDFEEF
ncbi:MAG: replicative DNA helicase [Candidatus Yonathbacteria bacterium CG10_big_fil_rev_8_21_14_0_10_43_136]|uniref:Replicative DNA helicase n=2 Tax=Parcubacteria group TaxID=1794811 RepID=A0A2M7Q4L1_9BACT|nr:MAG: replicative DNA helicase [Candidatus Nomurabacteria bacterium CG2_30_43_9]PIQ35775.1 MAG: replicative DNA helicase [Candidatus Yonathbacteria bacterium CG17_big_fil_post_rev_8_21_14_2_50_43_9]PIR40791.1 MAG: replicative DNA helicase [Candidatus Yonathbacteria bacterium CG10_big_fil_rev_8_21_14_0_10_43_136]PIX56865.1 MAG: replicative DNA helicase [Candidatus Yonathbacteria bacterium CG_4_10_14_3_um_filter_43_12]PIY58323.1 MAG: replicative DNA helicase [Candidatus Yonathbacteria bacterium